MDNQPKSIVMPIAITVLITAVIFGVGGFYLASGQIGADDTDTSDGVLTTPSPKVSTSPTATNSPSASTQTYENKTYNFTLKYPTGWNVIEKITAQGEDGTDWRDITFYKGATNNSASPRITFSINAPGRGAPITEIRYDVALSGNTLKVTNRALQTAEENEMGGLKKSAISFWNSGGSNITLKNKGYYILGENLSDRTNEDAAVGIVSSFTFTN